MSFIKTNEGIIDRQMQIKNTITLIFVVILVAIVISPFVYFIWISPNVMYEYQSSQTYPMTSEITNFQKPKATLFGINITPTLKQTGEVDFDRPNQYKVTFSTFLSTKKCHVVVDIVDWKDPEIKLKGDSELYLDSIDDFIEPGFTVTDNYDNGDRLAENVIVTINQIDNYTYEVLYDVCDNSENTADTAKRILHIANPVEEDETIVYLTFDGGPSKSITSEILDVLEDNDVSATFFVSGYEPDSDEEDIVKRAFENGNTIALLGYSSEPSKIYTSIDKLMDNYHSVQDLVEGSIGYKPSIIRFPGGTNNDSAIKICNGIMSQAVKKTSSEGLFHIDWNVDAQDFFGSNVSKEDIFNNVISGIKEGRSNVVLMHDSSKNKTSAEALSLIIDYCQEHGYIVKAISEESPVKVQKQVYN